MKTFKQYQQEELREASEVKLAQINPSQQAKIKKFEKALDMKSFQIWSGIHGEIVLLRGQNFITGITGGKRIFKKDMLSHVKQMLNFAKLDFRWVQFGNQEVTIGF